MPITEDRSLICLRRSQTRASSILKGEKDKREKPKPGGGFRSKGFADKRALPPFPPPHVFCISRKRTKEPPTNKNATECWRSLRPSRMPYARVPWNRSPKRESVHGRSATSKQNVPNADTKMEQKEKTALKVLQCSLICMQVKDQHVTLWVIRPMPCMISLPENSEVARRAQRP